MNFFSSQLRAMRNELFIGGSLLRTDSNLSSMTYSMICEMIFRFRVGPYPSQMLKSFSHIQAEAMNGTFFFPTVKP